MNKQNGFSYNSIFDETVDAVIITDGSSKKIIDINKAACELIGAAKKELLNDHLSNYLDEELVADLPKIKMFGSVLSNRKIKTKMGHRLPVDMTINTFGNGDTNYVMTTLRDISERIKYENDILNMNRELVKTNASKDKLFSIIAHDLKNPISALIGLSEIMADDRNEISDDEVAEFSGMIKNLSKSTYELLENLLNWSRVQTKNIEIDKREFNLFKLVKNIISVLKPSADLKKIILVNNIPQDYKIYADENMINTIIRNLISNSIKFTPEDKNITLKINDNDAACSISVIDEGVGMEESYIENLFKIDVYTSRYGTNREKGTGLGLVLCSEFAKLHGGNIEVQSRVDKGSEFIIHLPKEN